jgi:hypothetical protein
MKKWMLSLTLLATTTFADSTYHRMIIKFQCNLLQNSDSWRQSALHQMHSALSKGDEIIWVRDFMECGGILKIGSAKSADQLIMDFQQLPIVHYAEIDRPMYPASQESGS